MQLSAHFSLEELIRSRVAQYADIDNTPDAHALANLTRLATLLEAVRVVLGGQAITVSSGYRSPALNARVGGARRSAHLLGLAADFTCASFGSPLLICRTIAQSDLGFDQLIYEFDSWVHIGLAEAGQPERRQVLTIDQRGTQLGLVA
ncbi:peptidase M15 [Burkholderia sp. Bp9126]|nr:peptidase M15 [Burkholderia sp. Bp9126]